MKLTKTAFLGMIVAAAVAAANGATWTGADVANDPSWQNAKNWSGDVAPAAGDEAYFPNALGNVEIKVSDGDAAFVSSLARIYGTYNDRGPRIVFDVTTNFVVGCQVGTLPVVKRQTSSMALGNVASNTVYRSLFATVEEGTLILPCSTNVNGYWYMSGLVVSNGATVLLADALTQQATTTLPSLYCAGLLTNANASAMQGLRITGGTEEKPARFTETSALGGWVDFQPACPTVIDSENFTMTGYARLWTPDKVATPASLTIRKIGKLADASSSVGKPSGWGFLFNGGIWRYAGTGETTDRPLKYSVDWYNYNPYHAPTFDAGATGGVTFTGKWFGTRSYRNGTVYADTYDLVLTGSNTVPCVLANEITPVDSGGTNRPLYIVKQGTGTWRFNDHANRRNNSVIAVEEGTLQFETIAAKGSVCSLGTADALQERYFGVYDAARSVDYAYLLGTETTEGTMEHVGAGDAVCPDRPFRLVGDGRLKASGGRLCLADVSAQTAGEKTLTLDGANAVVNRIACVTNGAGTVSLVKDGAGTWRLTGGCDVSGDLAVRAGTLVVAGPDVPYTYFRFTSYETLGAADRLQYCYQTSFDELSFFSADGARRNLSLSWDADAHVTNGYYAVDVDVPALAPGHANYAFSSEWHYYANNAYGMNKLWNGATDTQPFMAWQRITSSDATAPTYTAPERRVSVVMRLAEGTPEITRYDFCSSSMNDRTVTNQFPKVFALEGSVDGVEWHLLHFKAGQTALSGMGRWCSDDTPFNTQYTNTGFSVTGRTAFDAQLASVRSVSVAAGATLRADGTAAPIRGLKVDASGAGTIDGFTFAASAAEHPCTLDVANVPPGSSRVVLPGTYLNCPGLANVAGWNLSVDGTPSAKYAILHENGCLALASKGTCIMFW